MKIALVYDRVNKFGGAERVLLALKSLFPDSPLYTLVHEPKKSSWSTIFDVRPTFLNQVSFFRGRHEILAPVASMSFETLDLREFDVIISVTSSDAKSVLTRPNQLHLCYCLTPTRYFWSGESDYQEDIKMRLLPRFIYNSFKYLDLVAASRPDVYISISNEVKQRVNNYYFRDSEVVYPPVDDKFFLNEPLSIKHRDYYLFVSRLVPYKKADMVINALRKINKPLVIVGDGSEKEKLMGLAGKKTAFVGEISDERLIQYYRHAIAVIFPQREDFGIVPVEAQACGTPVIAYGKGGATETIIDGKTGVFFIEQTEEALLSALKKLTEINIKPQDCVDNVKRFSQDNFLRNFKKHFDDACKSR